MARRNRETLMGNQLERPKLLMNREYVRDTHTDEEKLSKGSEFASAKMQDI